MVPRGCFQAQVLLYSGTWPLEGSRFNPPRSQFLSLKEPSAALTQGMCMFTCIHAWAWA